MLVVAAVARGMDLWLPPCLRLILLQRCDGDSGLVYLALTTKGDSQLLLVIWVQ